MIFPVFWHPGPEIFRMLKQFLVKINLFQKNCIMSSFSDRTPDEYPIFIAVSSLSPVNIHTFMLALRKFSIVIFTLVYKVSSIAVAPISERLVSIRSIWSLQFFSLIFWDKFLYLSPKSFWADSMFLFHFLYIYILYKKSKNNVFFIR